MERLIDADVLIHKLKTAIELGQRVDGSVGELKAVLNDLESMSTIDAEPVRHGKWIRQTDSRFGEMLNDILICSECKIAFPTVNMIRRSYCPNCGARMDAERKEE